MMNTDITTATQELSLGNDQLLWMAEQAEKRVAAINTIMRAALRMTTHLDWVKIGGTPYLQETGASKIGALMGVSWQIEPPQKTYDPDGTGHYAFQTSGKFFFAGRETEAMGLRSTRDEFFIGSASAKNPDGTPKPQKKPQDVDERDVMQSAYTNCLNNGIKRTVPGLRNITIEHLQESGIDTSKIRGYDFNSGSPAEMSDEAKDKKAELERMLKEVYGDKWLKGLEQETAFTGKDGAEVAGVKSLDKLSEKRVAVNYEKIKKKYEAWVKNHGGKADSGQAVGSQQGEDQALPVQ